MTMAVQHIHANKILHRSEYLTLFSVVTAVDSSVVYSGSLSIVIYSMVPFQRFEDPEYLFNKTRARQSW
jgi:hypothetical protein